MKKMFISIVVVGSLFCNIINVSANEREEVKLNKCVDGDTIKVEVNGEIKSVRFLAVDTPETKHPTKPVEPFGKEASKFTCDAVTKANKLELEYDSNSDKEDKYKRLLAWVVVDDNILQKDLIRKGYAKVAYLYDDYKYTNELQKLEGKAKEEKKGIWGEYKEPWYDKYIVYIAGSVVVITYITSTIRKARRKIKR